MKAVVLCVWMATNAVIAAEATHDKTGIASSNGLAMSIAHDNTAAGPTRAMRLQVTFRNLKSEDLTFIPGTLVFCGATPSKTGLVKLNLTDRHGTHRQLPYLGDGPPYAGGCGGQIQLFVVVLHSGESLTLPLDVGKYVDLSDSKEYEGARFPAGNYSLQAELASEPSEIPQALKTKDVWTGIIISNSLQIQFPSEFSAPSHDYAR